MGNKFESICNELVALQKAKNIDYGDSFSKSVKEFGLTAALIPITNKVNRLKQLIQSDSAQVKDESIDDTLKDLACYAIMTLAERKKGLFESITEKDTLLLADYIKAFRREVRNSKVSGINPISEKTEAELNEARIKRKLEADYITRRASIKGEGWKPVEGMESKNHCIGKLYMHIIPIIHKTKVI